MDFSQLPKMSDTPKPTTPEPEPRATPVQAVPNDYAPVGGMGFGFASVWISLILGLILMMMGANFGRWATAKLAGKELNTGLAWQTPERAGQPVTYFELQGGTAWSDAGLFLMGVALLADAALMFLCFRARHPSNAVLLGAILFTAIALGLNVGVAGYLFTLGILPLLTMGAILVGGMMLFDHVPMLRSGDRR